MCFSIIAQFGLECNSFPIGGSSFKACRRWEKICCLIRPLQLCFSNKANRRLENDLLLICSKHSKTKPKLLVGTDEWRQFCFGAWKVGNCSWLVLKCFIDWSFLKCFIDWSFLALFLSNMVVLGRFSCFHLILALIATSRPQWKNNCIIRLKMHAVRFMQSDWKFFPCVLKFKIGGWFIAFHVETHQQWNVMMQLFRLKRSSFFCRSSFEVGSLQLTRRFVPVWWSVYQAFGLIRRIVQAQWQKMSWMNFGLMLPEEDGKFRIFKSLQILLLHQPLAGVVFIASSWKLIMLVWTCQGRFSFSWAM